MGVDDATDATEPDHLGHGARATAAIARALREPVIPVLVLAGFFDLISGDPVVHGTLLITVALALGLDAVRRRRRERAGVAADGGGSAAPATSSGFGRVLARVRLSPVALMVGLSYVVIVGTFARYSWPASLAVFAPAALGIGVAWQGPQHPPLEHQKIERSGALVWAAAFVSLGLWELTNLFLQPSLTRGSQAHPTISVLMNPALATHAGRSIFLAAWLAFGLFLLER